VQWVLALY